LHPPLGTQPGLQLGMQPGLLLGLLLGLPLVLMLPPLELPMRVRKLLHRNRNRSFLVGLKHQGQSRYR